MENTKGEKKSNNIIVKYGIVLSFWLVIIVLILIEQLR